MISFIRTMLAYSFTVGAMVLDSCAELVSEEEWYRA